MPIFDIIHNYKSHKYWEVDTNSKHMTTLIYLQHIHNHIHLAGRYTWLHLNRVCLNIHPHLFGTFPHWSLQRQNAPHGKTWTVKPGRRQFILTLCSITIIINKTVTMETYLQGNRRQNGWPGPDMSPGSGKANCGIHSPPSHNESPQTLKP